jgi:hypothetical protein
MENCENFGDFSKYQIIETVNNVNNRAGHGSDERKNIKKILSQTINVMPKKLVLGMKNTCPKRQYKINAFDVYKKNTGCDCDIYIFVYSLLYSW